MKESILELAKVPEHSLPFMEAMSGGKHLRAGDYLFFQVKDGLLAVAYPLLGEYSHENFERALKEALAKTQSRHCYAVGPNLPPRLQAFVNARDDCLTLDAHAPVPPRLGGQASRAAETLRVALGQEFTPAHRRLWAEFLAKPGMSPQVRELFARTEVVLNNPACTDIYLLNATDKEGNLAAALLLDFSPAHFCTYLIGAHSRTHYTAHATDLLFVKMLAEARNRGKAYLHLGQGVNPGIRRFKEKWGARVSLPMVMADWPEKPATGMSGVAQIIMRTEQEPLSKVQMFQRLPAQKPFNMLWELEKGGVKSYIGGTAHFFCCSFEFSLRRLFEKVDTVLLEGPLDGASLNWVSKVGTTLEGLSAPDCCHLPGLSVADILAEDEICRLERVVRGPQGRLAHFLNMAWKKPVDVRGLLQKSRHWHAFFSCWTGFLERQGWQQSVDLEIHNLALDMDKNLVAMESIPEQIASLELVPVPRIRQFFCNCHLWDGYLKQNLKAYLAGDLGGMLGTSAEFPTRTEAIIDHRDQRFLARMRPYLERGGCAVFVGSAHMLGLRRMLVQEGYNLRQIRG